MKRLRRDARDRALSSEQTQAWLRQMASAGLDADTMARGVRLTPDEFGRRFPVLVEQSRQVRLDRILTALQRRAGERCAQRPPAPPAPG